MNRDPIGEDGGLNLYGFVLNDPVNITDPNGLKAFGLTGGFSIGLGLVIDVSFGIVFDTDGNIGALLDSDISLGPQIAFATSTPTVYYNSGTTCDMEGQSLEVQARLVGTEVGVATPDPTKDTNDTYAFDIPSPFSKGAELGVGIGPSYTKTWTFNPFK